MEKVIVNPENPVADLDLETIAKIYKVNLESEMGKGTTISVIL